MSDIESMTPRKIPEGVETPQAVRARLRTPLGVDWGENVQLLRKRVGPINFGNNTVSEEEAARLLESCEDDHRQFQEQQGLDV